MAPFGLESEDPIKQQYKDILITFGDHRYPLTPYSNFGWNAALRHSSCIHRYIQIIFFMFAAKYPQTYITPAFIHQYSTSVSTTILLSLPHFDEDSFHH